MVGKENKYADAHNRIGHLKGCLETLYTKCRQLMECLKEEQVLNNIFLSYPLSIQRMGELGKILEEHDREQAKNLKQLEEI